MRVKIPVVETVNSAFGFTFGNFTAIIRLIWLPMLLVFALDYLSSRMLAGSELSGLNFIRYVAYALGMMLLFSMMLASVAELALGKRQKVPFAHLALGLPEFRVFGAMLVYGLLMAFLLMVVGFGSWGLKALATSAAGANAGQIVAGTWELVALGFIIFSSVRLSFLLWVGVIAEERVSLERSWVLTDGSFWRILAVQIILFLPLVLLWSFLISALLSKDLTALQEQFAGQLNTPAYADAMQKLVETNQPVLTLLVMLFLPFFVALATGASAHAYKLTAAQKPLDLPETDAVS